MAKKKNYDIILLKCSECKRENYTTYKKRQLQEKLELKKYCQWCRKHTLHKEAKIKKGKK